ncbi:MAG: bifunctional demethylmenaquinone methyltransferase/2-methoxy-6-polyprenyl-1,4-benzoquinol methylase UbiE [Beijerinckiaceae bacterium]
MVYSTDRNARLQKKSFPLARSTAFTDTDATTHFGFETVPTAQKQGRVNDVFHSVAAKYDVMNDVMSVGLHRIWKDALIAQLRPPSHRPFRHLDVAGGTGDVAFRILEAAGDKAHVTVLDINGSMLGVGEDRAARRQLPGTIDFMEASAEDLPYPDKTFDGYTIAFGIRNVPRIPVALAEAYRTLKTGGRFLCLEFAPVDTPVLDKIYDTYSFNLIPAFGKAITGDGESYRYLVESIRQFPKPEAFARMIAKAGFRRVSHRSLSGGIVNIHSGWKL